MGSFTTLEQTNITAKFMQNLAEDQATTQVFEDGTDTYANNLTNLQTIVAAVTAALFNVTAPTKLP
jgi:hypothetical protein